MKQYHVIGVMSGTSLDGIDFAEITLKYTDKWFFELGICSTYAYTKDWIGKLKSAVHFSESELKILNEAYTNYLAEQILKFRTQNDLKNIDAVCSHGHTVLHQPKQGITLQIGNLPNIAALVQQNVVCDFRTADVALGGQGAPLVPVGDALLFKEYRFCLNLGGFSNVSYEQNGERLAYDICAVNTVFNYLANALGLPYDEGGNLARSGTLNEDLLKQLNCLPFFQEKPPKSLGIEWVEAVVLPLIAKYEIDTKDKLHTFAVHVAQTIAADLKAGKEDKLLITGGGAYNNFLIRQLKKYSKAEVILPSLKIIEYKEALIFGLLGVLRLRDEINALKSVTGAKKDHSSGQVFQFS